jgi:hypothetical protein
MKSPAYRYATLRSYILSSLLFITVFIDVDASENAKKVTINPTVFTEDLAINIRQSTPSSINIPLGLSSQFDIEYIGAFRVSAAGDSNSSYAVGTLEYSSASDSLYVAGHAHHNAIAEFEVPEKLSFALKAADILEANVLQDYVSILGKQSHGNKTDRITGMLYHKGALLVNSEIWYDASASNKDNLIVVNNAFDLKSSTIKGMLQLEGAAKSAGYMSAIPPEWQAAFGGKFLTGWASNYSINSRYSQGPSLYVFNPDQVFTANLDSDRLITTKAKMVFPLQKGKMLVEGSDVSQDIVSPIWSAIANARHGFIVPNSNTFMVLGTMAGLHSGIGYKITQDTGNTCGGGCTKQADDVYNYFWLFDVQDILNAEQPYTIKPYSYGKWSHPYDKGGKHGVIGATFDSKNQRLFITLDKAGQVGMYDRQPLIVTYKINVK